MKKNIPEKISILSPKDILPKHLEGGSLSLVAASAMLTKDKDRQHFLQLVTTEKGKHKALIPNYAKLYGYTLSKECEEWAETIKAYGKFHRYISDVWSIEENISKMALKPMESDTSKYINNFYFTMNLFTGLEMFGMDPSGDSCCISTLPTPLNTAEIYLYNHENGEIEDCMGHSLTEMIATFWCFYEDDDYEYDEEVEESEGEIDKTVIPKETFEAFEKKALDSVNNRPLWRNPEMLFQRSHWLMGHASGETVYAFAKKMAKAPTYKTWEEELTLLADEPVLANYWLLAHYFLGNTDACRTTCKEAQKAKGEFTRQLALIIEQLLDKPASASLGKLKPKKLAELIKETRKNCFSEQLEPAQRKLLDAERGEDTITKLSEKELKSRIESGADLWKLMEEFQDDVSLHDTLLKKLGETEFELKKIIPEYFSNRTHSSSNEWPYDLSPSHHRLSIPIAAAFRSGLKFDIESPKSFSGITIALGKIDDDNTMKAFRMAIEKLKQDDDRLEYIIEALAESKHPEAISVLRIGAWKFFDQFKTTVSSIEKTTKEGANLNNIFKVHTHLKKALDLSIDTGDDEAVKLVEKVLGMTENISVLGKTIGIALRLAGDRKMLQYTKYAAWYCPAVTELIGESLSEVSCYNLSEASIAYVKLNPEEAHKTLKNLFEKEYKDHGFTIDIRASLLGGLLLLEPSNKNFLYWTERILGNRNGNFRVYGTLRGIEEAKLKEAAKWALHHVYANPMPFDNWPKLIEHVARTIFKNVLNKPLPPFDEKDKYASSIKVGDLPIALTQPEKYSVEHVMEKIGDKEYKHPLALTNLIHCLMDSLRYSIDDSGYDTGQLRWNAVKAIRVQGEESLPELAKFFTLKEIDPNWHTSIIYTMRTIEPEANILQWLVNSDETTLFGQLVHPEPRFIPWLDLLAAFAIASYGEKAKEAVAKALEFRYRLTSVNGENAGWEDQEPSLLRLPKLYALFGEKPKKLLNDLLDSLKNSYKPADHLKTALKQNTSLKSLNDTVPQLEEKGNSVIRLGIGQAQLSYTHHTIDIACKGNALTIKCVTDNLYFQGLIKNKRLESATIANCNSPSEAIQKANRLIRTVAYLGYVVPVKKAKKIA